MTLALYILALIFLMSIIFAELYFILKKVILNLEFKNQRIKDKKYTAALYKFYVYSKYHSKDSITDFFAEFKKFYELDNLSYFSDEYTEFNIKRSSNNSKNVSNFAYPTQMGDVGLEGNEQLTTNIIANLEQLNAKISNLQSQTGSNVPSNNQELSNVRQQVVREQPIATPASNVDPNGIDFEAIKNMQKKPAAKASARVEARPVAAPAPTPLPSNTEAPIEKKRKAKRSKANKKDQGAEASPYFDESTTTLNVKKSKKEILAEEKDKKEKADLKKLMSTV